MAPSPWAGARSPCGFANFAAGLCHRASTHIGQGLHLVMLPVASDHHDIARHVEASGAGLVCAPEVGPPSPARGAAPGRHRQACRAALPRSAGRSSRCPTPRRSSHGWKSSPPTERIGRRPRLRRVGGHRGVMRYWKTPSMRPPPLALDGTIAYGQIGSCPGRSSVGKQLVTVVGPYSTRPPSATRVFKRSSTAAATAPGSAAASRARKRSSRAGMSSSRPLADSVDSARPTSATRSCTVRFALGPRCRSRQP
jgi:hypothetical protein